MTVKDLAQLITRRIIARAQEEPDPKEYFSRAIAAMQILEHCAVKGLIPPGRFEHELLQFGRKFGLLVQGVEKELTTNSSNTAWGPERG
jgi:hypothetical protein